MSAYAKDLAERLGWTVAEVVVAFGLVEISDLDAWWVVPATSLLMLAKGIVAKHVGDPDTAALK